MRRVAVDRAELGTNRRRWRRAANGALALVFVLIGAAGCERPRSTDVVTSPSTSAATRPLPTPEFVMETRFIDQGKLAWRLGPATTGASPAITAEQAASVASRSPGGDASPDEILYSHLTGGPMLDVLAWVVVFRDRPCLGSGGGASAVPTTTPTTTASCDSAVAVDAATGDYLAAIIFAI